MCRVFCHNCGSSSVELSERLYENGSIQMCLQEIWEAVGTDALRVVASCAHDAKGALRS